MCVFCELLKIRVCKDWKAIKRLDLDGKRYKPPVDLKPDGKTFGKAIGAKKWT